MAGLAYGVAGMLGLPAMRPAQLDLRGPGFAWAGLAYALAIANGPERRGSVRLCPGASASDGALDITIVPAHLELGQVLELIDEGSVATLADVARFRSPWIELRARPALVLEVAGERRRCAHARFDLAPTALAVAAAELGPTPTQSARAGSG